MVHRYYHRSILISWRDTHCAINLNLKSPISMDSVSEDQEFVFENRSKKSQGCTPHLLLEGLRPFPPPRWVLNVWLQWCWMTRTVHLAYTLLDRSVKPYICIHTCIFSIFVSCHREVEPATGLKKVWPQKEKGQTLSHPNADFWQSSRDITIEILYKDNILERPFPVIKTNIIFMTGRGIFAKMKYGLFEAIYVVYKYISYVCQIHFELIRFYCSD